MPIREGIEYGVNEALPKIMSRPIRTTPDLPLATRINLLKDKDPKRYQENMQRLIQLEKDGNEEARKLLGEIGEDAGRSRRGYEKLATAMTIAPMLPVAGGVALKAMNNPWLSTGFDVATGNYGDAAVGLVTDLIPGRKIVKYVPQPVKDGVLKSLSKVRNLANGVFNKYVNFARKHYDLPQEISDDKISDLIAGNKYDIENYSDQLNEINIPEIFNEGTLKNPDFNGSESSVYLLGDHVIKLSNPASENTIRKDIARMLSKNTLGNYGVRNTFLGVVKDGENFRAAYSQPFVKQYFGRHFGDLGDVYARLKLKKQGFKTYNISGTSGKAMISPNGIIVDDIKGRNIGVVDGKLVLFDPYHAIHKSNIPNGSKSITDAVSLSGKSIWRDNPSSMVDWYDENPFKKDGGKL